MSIHKPFPYLSLLPALLPDLLPTLLSTLNPDLLFTTDLLILIPPVLCSISRDAALVLVEVLHSLDVLLGLLGGPIGYGLFSQAPFNTDSTFFTINDVACTLLTVFFTIVGKLGHDFLLGVFGNLGAGEW